VRLAIVLVAACGSAPAKTERARPAPQDFCQALDRIDIQAASKVVEAKIASLGGHRDPSAVEPLMRSWFHTQRCVVDIDATCRPTHLREFVVSTERPKMRVRVNLHAEIEPVAIADECITPERARELRELLGKDRPADRD
jgi:hypothetical protein